MIGVSTKMALPMYSTIQYANARFYINVECTPNYRISRSNPIYGDDFFNASSSSKVASPSGDSPAFN